VFGVNVALWLVEWVSSVGRRNSGRSVWTKFCFLELSKGSARKLALVGRSRCVRLSRRDGLPLPSHGVVRRHRPISILGADTPTGLVTSLVHAPASSARDVVIEQRDHVRSKRAKLLPRVLGRLAVEHGGIIRTSAPSLRFMRIESYTK
jgi:hypothetical protein